MRTMFDQPFPVDRSPSYMNGEESQIGASEARDDDASRLLVGHGKFRVDSTLGNDGFNRAERRYNLLAVTNPSNRQFTKSLE